MVGTAHATGAIATSAILLPALGFALGPLFEEHKMRWQPVGKPDEFPDDTYVPKVISLVDGIGEAGKTTVYIRKRNPQIDTDKLPKGFEAEQFVAISTRCMHLGCPVRYTEAAQRFICPCHGGVYDFQGKVDGGPPVRPLDRFYNRVHNGQLEIGPRFSVNRELKRFSPRQPGRAARRDRWDPVPVAPDDPEARLAPDGLTHMPQAQAPRSASAARPASRAAASGAPKQGPVEKAAEAGIYTVDWIDERTALSGGLRWLMFRKVPKGTNWFYTLGSATMFAFLSQAITGVFLAMYYRPDAAGGAYESVRHINDDVFLGEFVHGMHKWGSSVMVVLIFLHMARTFFFGAYKYPRELNWVIGVALLILTFVMALTGYLLPFDQRSFWGDDRGEQHHRVRPARRPLPRRLPQRRLGLQRDDAVALLCDPHAVGARHHRGPHRRAPVPRDAAGHHGAPVAEGQARRRADRGAGVNRREKEEYPPRVLDPEVPGQAVLPLRGRQGRRDGLRRAARHHLDVDLPRRRARPEGRPDDDDPTRRARSGTSSSSSSCCASSSRRSTSPWRRSASRRSA